ncbi:uncharacterized protein METZ01_LOCUS249013, partial [marine metagenome]
MYAIASISPKLIMRPQLTCLVSTFGWWNL